MQTKSEFIFYTIVVLIVITIIIGYIYEKLETKNLVDIDETMIDEIMIENKMTVEIETDREGYTEKAIEPIETIAESVEIGTVIGTKESTKIETEELIKKPIETETETEVIENNSLFYLNDYQREVAERIVMGESGIESYVGQVLVAQCLLNACLKDGLLPSEVREKYKYAGWHNKPSDSVEKAVSAVFDDGYKVTDEFILYFYAPMYCESDWHESQRFVIEEGGHRFFAEWDE